MVSGLSQGFLIQLDQGGILKLLGENILKNARVVPTTHETQLLDDKTDIGIEPDGSISELNMHIGVTYDTKTGAQITHQGYFELPKLQFVITEEYAKAAGNLGLGEPVVKFYVEEDGNNISCTVTLPELTAN